MNCVLKDAVAYLEHTIGRGDNVKPGIVILNYGTPKETCDLLLKIHSFNIFHATVIVDNFSVDDSTYIIKNFIQSHDLSNAYFIQTTKNGGYAKGNNIGLRLLVEQFECDICFIANPDITFRKKDIVCILKAFEETGYGVLTCRRVVDNGTKLRQYWKLPTFTDILLDKLYFFRKKHKNEEIYYVSNENGVIDIPVAPGAFWAVKSNLLSQVNYLDEETFLFYEENCFARKIINTGYKIGLVKNAEYCVLSGKASTEEMKKNGKMMQYLIESQKHYIKKYLKVGPIQMLTYDFFCKINEGELKLNRIIGRKK